MLQKFSSYISYRIGLFRFGEAGITQVLLLVLLTSGLIVGVYAVQYVRTVLEPEAYETDEVVSEEENSEDKKGDQNCKDQVRCENDMAIKYYRSTDDPVNKTCKEERQPTNLSCVQAFCDDLTYYDPNAEHLDPDSGKLITGWLIYKYASSYDPKEPNPINRCQYVFVPKSPVGIISSVPSGKAAGISEQCRPEIYCDDVFKDNPNDTEAINQFIYKHVNSDDAFESNGSCKWRYDKTGVSCKVDEASKASLKAGLEVKYGIRELPASRADEDSKICEPGKQYAGWCARCNSTGNTYNKLGTDWGTYTGKGDAWCACASIYSKEIYGKEYDQDNYPQCL